MPLSASELCTLYREKSPAIDWDKTVRHICLYSNGRVTRARENSSCSSLLCSIDVPYYYYNTSKARLLFCYDNGCVNIMNPKQQLEDKLHRPGMKSNGYKLTSRLARVFVCNKTDWLAIFSRTSGGLEYLRLFSLEKRTVHKSMNAAGNQFIKDERAYRWKIIPDVIVGKFPSRFPKIVQRGLPHYEEIAALLSALEKEDTHILCPKVFN